MKLGYRLVFLILILAVCGCKNSPGETVRQQAAEAAESVPAYDSLSWLEEFEFKKLNPSEKKEKYEQISRFYRDQWLKSNASGGLIVAREGQILFEAYNGYSDLEQKTEINAETPIHIASVSKVLTALAVLKLIQFDRIDLQSEVSRYINGFPYKVTVQQLLTHRSGLPDYLNLSDDKNYWDNSKMMTNRDVVSILTDRKPEAAFRPGTKFTYNNTNYLLLAVIIEKVTGMSYPQAMKHIVFDPLGMTHTFVMEFDKDSKRVSKSYYNNGNLWDYDHLDKTYGDKNIYSTPRDLLKMDIAMYSDRFLPKKLKEMAWKGYSYEKEGIKNYGFGIRMYEWDNGEKLLYHKGLWHGNRSTYVRDFKDRVCVVALGNRLNRSIYKSMGLISLFRTYPYPAPDLKSLSDSPRIANSDPKNRNTGTDPAEGQTEGGDSEAGL